MRKTFPLTEPGKVDARVVEKTKHEIKKYIKREQGKKLPEGMKYWESICKIAYEGFEMQRVPCSAMGKHIDAAVAAGCIAVEVDIVCEAKAVKPKVVEEDDDAV